MTSLALLLILVALPLAMQEHSTSPAPSPPAPPPSATIDDCDRLAAPHGSDDLAGTRDRPFRSVRRLLTSLAAGQTGCLLPGRYGHDRPVRMRRPGTRLVGLGWPEVDGALWIAAGAADAQIRGLDLTASDDTFFIPLKVQADGALIAGNRVRASRSTSCVLIGSTHRTRQVRIEDNWIHDCGRVGKLDHLIYVQNAYETVVRGNVLNANDGGWAVHLYPDADRTLIERNLIDGNRGGVIFAGDDRSSDANLVRWNVITDSGPRWNLEASWNEAVGSGNVAEENCLHTDGPGAPSGVAEEIGFETEPSIGADSSPYVSPDTGDYRFRPGSPCAELVEPLPAAFPAR